MYLQNTGIAFFSLLIEGKSAIAIEQIYLVKFQYI